MALRVSSFYPTSIVIDGEIIPIKITRLNPDQALTFNQQFARLGRLGKKKGDADASPPSAEDVDKATADEAESKRFVVSAISDYVQVQPHCIIEDDKEEGITAGADLCRLFGARDEVLSELLLHIFMENKLNAEQKRTWKTSLAPFVPTPPAVADRMMQLAKVTPDDVVYDLGCGAGALCIAAAKAGARAVGFDVSEERISEARAAAVAGGVADRCTFEQKDALEVDPSPATVVALYLLTGSCGKLRPVLLEKMRPGSRVVSHAFTMGGDWIPYASEFVPLGDGEELVHTGARWVYAYTVNHERTPARA